MISSFLHKITLVSNGGIALGEYPKSPTDDRAILEGGITVAIMSFSKEIHKQELLSIRMENYNVFFISLDDFVFVLEIIKETDEDLVLNILKEVRKNAQWLVKGFDPFSITNMDAEVILNEIAILIHRYELLQEMKKIENEIDIADAEIVTYTYNSSVNFPHDSPQSNNPFIQAILDIVKEKSDTNIQTGILNLSNENRIGYFVRIREIDRIQIGVMLVPDTQFREIITLKPIIDDQINLITGMGKMEIKDLLNTILTTANTSVIVSTINDFDKLSFHLLKRAYPLTDQLLNAVLHNNKLLIVGDKSFVIPVISTLKIFLEGKALELIYWVNTNDYAEFDIAGISQGRYLEIRDEMNLSDFIIIDINYSVIVQDPNSQLVSNQYLADEFNKLINLGKREAIGYAKSIINEINEQIFDIMGDKLTIKAMIYYEEKEKLAHSICRRINNW